MGKNIYLIVAPSGTGKTTLVEKLAKDHGLKTIESYSTRQPRYPGETGHIFVTNEEFDALGDMLAYTKYNGFRYGVTADVVNSHDLYVIDPSGVIDIQKKYKGPKGVKVIFLKASPEERFIRMKKRGDSADAIAKRMHFDKEAFDTVKYPICSDFTVHADGIDETAQAVWEFISYHEKYDFDVLVYQIVPELDKERVIFASSGSLRRKQGKAHSETVQLNLGIYDMVWAGDLKVTSLEDVFSYFNGVNRPNAHAMRSLSCSDIVEIKHNPNNDLNGMWFCDAVGWKKVEHGYLHCD